MKVLFILDLKREGNNGHAYLVETTNGYFEMEAGKEGNKFKILITKKISKVMFDFLVTKSSIDRIATSDSLEEQLLDKIKNFTRMKKLKELR